MLDRDSKPKSVSPNRVQGLPIIVSPNRVQGSPIIVSPKQVGNSPIVVSKNEKPLLLTIDRKPIFEALDDLNESIQYIKKIKRLIIENYTPKTIPPNILNELKTQVTELQKGFSDVLDRRDSFLKTCSKDDKTKFKVKLYRAKGGFQNITKGYNFGLFTPLAKINEELQDTNKVQTAILEDAFRQKEIIQSWGKYFRNLFTNTLQDSITLVTRCFTLGLVDLSSTKTQSKPKEDERRPSGENPGFVQSQEHNNMPANHEHPHNINHEREN